jgi:hypothetical protein
MRIKCTREATRRLTDEGDRIEFDRDGVARVKKEIGERVTDKYDSIEILEDETEDDG